MTIKLFTTVKEIRSRVGDLYFKRYAIIEVPNWFGLYIHTIYKADADLNLHNHPWNFVGLVLKGSYVEQTVGYRLNTKRPGTLSIGSRYFFHTIASIVRGPVKSLFLTWGKHEPWGYMDGYTESHVFRTKKHSNSMPLSAEDS